MTTTWALKEPQGLASSRSFPFVSNYWKAISSEPVYFAGLTADIGIEPKEIKPVVLKVLSYLRNNGFSPQKFCGHKLDSAHNIEKQLSELLDNISSNWYSDKVWIELHNDAESANVFVEPQSDGTELGLFFYGAEAASEFRKIHKWIVRGMKSS